MDWLLAIYLVDFLGKKLEFTETHIRVNTIQKCYFKILFYKELLCEQLALEY